MMSLQSVNPYQSLQLSIMQPGGVPAGVAEEPRGSQSLRLEACHCAGAFYALAHSMGIAKGRAPLHSSRYIRMSDYLISDNHE